MDMMDDVQYRGWESFQVFQDEASGKKKQLKHLVWCKNGSVLL